PWKLSFDRETGDLWVGDVGQSRWEEIIRVESGGNYGWPEVEGPECHRAGCDVSAYDPPVYAYPHDTSPEGGFSVTGGVVYRGTALPGLQGRYLFADFVLPKVWALDEGASGGPSADVVFSGISNIVSINEDADGEVLLTSITEGKVYRLTFAVLSSDPEAEGAGVSLSLASANPVRDQARLQMRAAPGSAVRVAAFDARGRELAVLFDGPAPADALDLTFDVRMLAPGAVFVRAQSDAGRAVLPVVIAR
ncbi:MAG: PQQ-dependent sugar dehydrogenase, partial [Bacteroidota bacterium]